MKNLILTAVLSGLVLVTGVTSSHAFGTKIIDSPVLASEALELVEGGCKEVGGKIDCAKKSFQGGGGQQAPSSNAANQNNTVNSTNTAGSQGGKSYGCKEKNGKIECSTSFGNGGNSPTNNNVPTNSAGGTGAAASKCRVEGDTVDCSQPFGGREGCSVGANNQMQCQ